MKYHAVIKPVFFVLAMILTGPALVQTYAQGEDTPRTGQVFKVGQALKPGSQNPGLETDSCLNPQPTRAVMAKDPFAQALQDARTAGDRAAVRRLEDRIRKNRPPETGEAAFPKVTRVSTTRCGPGERVKESDPGGLQNGGAQGIPKTSKSTYFGADRHVRNQDLASGEFNQTMASDSAGNYYVAWQDDSLNHDYIQIYRSQNKGFTWEPYAFLYGDSADLREPSLAVGEGNECKLLVAYIVDDGVNMPVPEVAVAPLGSASFTFHSPTLWSWAGYGAPVIWTDAADFQDWYAYLTCHGQVYAGTDNVNVAAFRATNYGTSWDDRTVVFGNTDSHKWIFPDGTFGTTQKDSYIVCCDDTDFELYVASSQDYGVTYSLPHLVHDLTVAGWSERPYHGAYPAIGASLSSDHLLVCLTLEVIPQSSDCIVCAVSPDAGNLWTDLQILPKSSGWDEYGVALTPDNRGGYFHMAFTRAGGVFYAYSPSNGYSWGVTDHMINDFPEQSQGYWRKGIAAGPGSYACAITWASERDGAPDLDTYSEHTYSLNEIWVPLHYETIQEALDNAPTYCSILVSPGTYRENIDFLGKAVTVKSTEGALHTVLDGEQKGSVVTFANGEGKSSKLFGFTITNGNSAAGGGIRCNGLYGPTVANCVITGNSALKGGGIYCNMTLPDLYYVTVTDNDALSMGGGMYCETSGDPTAVNCIFWNNHAPKDPGIHVEPGPTDPTINYCCVQDGWPSGTGNIDGNPFFVNAGEGDFHITAGSPCRNAGGLVDDLDEDFEGDPRGTAAWDMGADEFHIHLYHTGHTKPGGDITLNIVGMPTSNQVGIWFGLAALDEPISGPYGGWWLLPPLLGPVILGVIPKTGVITLPGTLPTFPGPYTVYMQGIVGPPLKLTNLCPMTVN